MRSVNNPTLKKNKKHNCQNNLILKDEIKKKELFNGKIKIKNQKIIVF